MSITGSVAGISVNNNDKSYAMPQIVNDEEEKADESWRYNDSFNTEGYDHIV